MSPLRIAILLCWWLSAPMTLRAVLSGATAPVIVSHGNLVQGEGPDLERFKDLYGSVSWGKSNLFQIRETKAPSWNKAWEGISLPTGR